MTTLVVDRFSATLRGVPPGAEGRFDDLLRWVAATELERAWGAPALPAGHWCVRRLDLELRLDPAGRAAARTWADAVVAAVHGAVRSGDVVHFRHDLDAVADAVAELAAGRPGRAWAWRQAGVLAPGDPAAPDAAVLAVLGRHPGYAVPAVVRALPRCGLPALDRLLGAPGWTALAELAWPTGARRPGSPPRGRARTLVASSELAAAITATRLRPGLAAVAAWAVLVAVHADPAVVTRPGAGELLAAVAAELTGAAPPDRARRAGREGAAEAGGLSREGIAGSDRSDGPAGPGGRAGHPGRAEPSGPHGPAEPDGRPGRDGPPAPATQAGPVGGPGRAGEPGRDRLAVRDGRPGSDSPSGRGEPVPPAATGAAPATDDPPAAGPDPAVPGPDPAVPSPDPAAPSPDPTVPNPDPAAPSPDPVRPAPDGGLPTEWGGLPFLLATAADIDLPTVEPALAGRPLAWVLCAAGRAAAPVPDGDPALLALAGLDADRAARLRRAPAAGAGEQAAIDRLAAAWIAATADRLAAAGAADPRAAALAALRRPARVFAEPGWVEVHLPLTSVDPVVRRAGLDIDPGWTSWLGAVVRYVHV